MLQQHPLYLCCTTISLQLLTALHPELFAAAAATQEIGESKRGRGSDGGSSSSSNIIISCNSSNHRSSSSNIQPSQSTLGTGTTATRRTHQSLFRGCPDINVAADVTPIDSEAIQPQQQQQQHNKNGPNDLSKVPPGGSITAALPPHSFAGGKICSTQSSSSSSNRDSSNMNSSNMKHQGDSYVRWRYKSLQTARKKQKNRPTARGISISFRFSFGSTSSSSSMRSSNTQAKAEG